MPHNWAWWLCLYSFSTWQAEARGSQRLSGQPGLQSVMMPGKSEIKTSQPLAESLYVLCTDICRTCFVCSLFLKQDSRGADKTSQWVKASLASPDNLHAGRREPSPTVHPLEHPSPTNKCLKINMEH